MPRLIHPTLVVKSDGVQSLCTHVRTQSALHNSQNVLQVEAFLCIQPRKNYFQSSEELAGCSLVVCEY